MNDIKAQLRPTSTRPLPVECGCRPIFLTLAVVMPWIRCSNAWSAAGQLRRIDRDLYDRPRENNQTKKTAAPDYRAVVDSIARRDQLRLLVDGMTAANDLGLTDAVLAHSPSIPTHAGAPSSSII